MAVGPGSVCAVQAVVPEEKSAEGTDDDDGEEDAPPVVVEEDVVALVKAATPHEVIALRCAVCSLLAAARADKVPVSPHPVRREPQLGETRHVRQVAGQSGSANGAVTCR